MSAKRSSPRGYPAVFVLLVIFMAVGLAVMADAASAGASVRPRMSGFSAGAYVSSQPGGYFIQASAPLTTPTPPSGPPDLVAVIYQMNCDGPTLALITMNTRIPRPVTAPSTMRLTNSAGDFVEFPVPAGFFYTHQVQCRIGTCVTADWASALPFTLTVDYYNTVVEEVETNNTAGLATLTPCQTITPTYTVTPTPTSNRVVDLAGIVTWTNTCTATVILRMQTYIFGPTFMRTAVPSTMRAQNNNGDIFDVAVPQLDVNRPSYTFDCVLGSCLPTSWATAIPITLTVDYFNQVFEHDETNNVSTMPFPPPMPTPCPPDTVTPTNTAVRTSTNTRVPTYQTWPDLVGDLNWLQTCVTTTLRVTTRTIHYPAKTSSTMRLTSNDGEYLEFAVPSLGYGGQYSVDCQLGQCVPFSWLNSLPFTLIVDYYDTVRELNEYNNTTTLNFPPPMPTPCVTATPTPCSMDFPDVQPTDYFYEAVRFLYCDGDISGYADGRFRPYNNALRGHTAKILVLGFNIPIYVPPPPCTFWDTCTDNPYYDYVETAVHHELISGYADGSFRPYITVTRGQTAKIVMLAAQMVRGWTLINPVNPTFSDVPPGSPFYAFVETAACYGVITGYADGTFRPFNQATRGQISKIVHLGFTGNLSCAGPFEPQDGGSVRLLHASSAADGYAIQASVPFTTPTPALTRTFTPTPTMNPSHTPAYTETATATDTATETASPTVTPCPMNFSDVRPNDYFYEGVRYLYCDGAVSGYANGAFRPYNNVTKAQIIKMLYFAYDIPPYTPPTPTFCDVPVDHPFFLYIESYWYYYATACGSCECFYPYRNMTRGQLTKVLVLLADWPIYTPPTPTFVDVPTTDTFYQYIETAYHHGVISGYANRTFRPYNTITRGQVSKVIHRAIAGGMAHPPTLQGND